MCLAVMMHDCRRHHQNLGDSRGICKPVVNFATCTSTNIYSVYNFLHRYESYAYEDKYSQLWRTEVCQGAW
ncbi:unnamed protein product [Pylaiella littoralis]